MPICRYGVVSGRVQGVGFRAFVARSARACGVTGFANNLPDGRVEVLLCGASEAVAAVQAEVAVGPPSSLVEQLHWQPAEQTPPPDFTTG